MSRNEVEIEVDVGLQVPVAHLLQQKRREIEIEPLALGTIACPASGAIATSTRTKTTTSTRTQSIFGTASVNGIAIEVLSGCGSDMAWTWQGERTPAKELDQIRKSEINRGALCLVFQNHRCRHNAEERIMLIM